MKIKNKHFFITIFSILVVFFVSFKATNITDYHQKLDTKYDNADDWAKNQLNKLTLQEKVGQFFMVAAYSNQSEEHLREVEKYVEQDKIGGIIFFQGERSNLKNAINRYQLKSKTPLLIGLDAEWGIQMRIFGEERFPYLNTIGAANNLVATEKIGSMMAQECREIGIHMNFSPVADVNSNPKNPVIGFRSFGENQEHVSNHVAAMVKGMEENGILTSIKHFPGHGDTDKDSHFELPTVSKSVQQFKDIDFKPFISGIKAGSGSVMVGHLNVPHLDTTGTPSSLSKSVIQEYLIKQLNFRGLVISDALNMKAVADKYGKSEVCVKAFEAGCDILLFPEIVTEAIDAIVKKVNRGDISKEEIDKRCLKVLKAKFNYIIQPKTLKKYSEGEVNWAKKDIYEKAFCVLKNEEELLPLKKMNQKIARISIGQNTYGFRDGLDRFSSMDHFHFYTVEEALERMKDKIGKYDVILTVIHANSVRSKNKFGLPEKFDVWTNNLPKEAKKGLIIFGNPNMLSFIENDKIYNSIALAYENNVIAQERMSQFVMGAIPMNGKLAFTISDNYKIGDGIPVKWGGRLKFSQPEELGISESDLKEIDRIAQNGITQKAFPGCQIVVAYDGKIFYQKSFGTKTYDAKDTVLNDDIYDIASVTKIAGSTFGMMKLQSQGKFSTDKYLKDYIHEVTGDGDFGNIYIKDMMTHQAGLTPWIAFYKKTLKNGELNPSIYSETKKKGFETKVANDLWIRDDYKDSIYKQILNSNLGPKKYEYSDLGYYFIKKIIEKQTSKSLDDFLSSTLYEPMGLQFMGYQPLNKFKKEKIAPTENDRAFRHRQVHGYVHDPGAAMMGGVAGHAGLFSNATDLASVMQLFMNNGFYGGVNYINEDVVNEYTKCQFCPNNRRGIGFDRPKSSGGGTCASIASQSSYGHSGFTGTLAWADPEYKINFVFLSNRVFPSQDNWKIRDMNIRTDIQEAIYKAVINAKLSKK